MDVKVLGKGCAKCHQLEDMTKEVLAELGVAATVEHVNDLREIASYGVLTTPGLVIDGVVKSAGRVPSKGEIASWVTSALGQHWSEP